MKVSVYWLAKATGKHPGTIRKRLADVDADKNGKFDSATALEAIYVGRAPGENGFISTPEAVRLLTLEKKTQIELQNAKFREEFYPRDFVHFTIKHAMAIVTQTLKANVNRLLTFETVNDIFRQFREAFADMRDNDELEKEYEQEKNERAQAGNGSSGERQGGEGSNSRPA